MNETLYYLEAAEKMGWHLLDFYAPPAEFAREFVFSLYRDRLLYSAWNAGSFEKWAPVFRKVLKEDEQAIIAELDACLFQAEELDYSLGTIKIAAYVDVNEYAHFLFKRLQKYVDAFWFEHQLYDEDEYEQYDEGDEA